MTDDQPTTVHRTEEYPSEIGGGDWSDLECGCRYTVGYDGELCVICCSEHNPERTRIMAMSEYDCEIYEQGQMDKRTTEITCYRSETGTISEGQIRQLLSKKYGGDNSTREFVQNEREDEHGTIGSVVYSLSGSPPKGYAIHDTGLNSEVWLYDVHGDKFARIGNVQEVVS